MSLGYTGLYWALGEGDWLHCYELSGSSLLTLGTTSDFTACSARRASTTRKPRWGCCCLRCCISYLPTIYQAFARREATVAQLELRAGTPPTAAGAAGLAQPRRLGAERRCGSGPSGRSWFVEIEESHTSLPILSFFRSPQPGRSWVTAGGLILDTAALLFAAVDGPQPRQAQITFKAGCLAHEPGISAFSTTKAGSRTHRPAARGRRPPSPAALEFRPGLPTAGRQRPEDLRRPHRCLAAVPRVAQPLRQSPGSS